MFCRRKKRKQNRNLIRLWDLCRRGCLCRTSNPHPVVQDDEDKCELLQCSVVHLYEYMNADSDKTRNDFQSYEPYNFSSIEFPL